MRGAARRQEQATPPSTEQHLLLDTIASLWISIGSGADEQVRTSSYGREILRDIDREPVEP